MKTNLISSKWLKGNINKSNIIILDASQPSKSSIEELKGIQIKGARKFRLKNFSDQTSNFPNTFPSKKQFKQESEKLGITNDSHIVIYDNQAMFFSPRVWFMFKAMGYKNVFILNGGLKAAIETRVPTESVAINNETVSFNLQLNFKQELVKGYDFIYTNNKSNHSLLVDARSSGRFNGTHPEPRKEILSGCIPNSINIPYTEVIKEGYFKSKDDLQLVFKDVITTNKPLTFSCGSGITACIILFAYLLIDPNKTVSIYDGSWTEWAIKNNLLI